MMTFEHDADDFEPVDANERCDADYGAYHIGRCVETRDEVALMFDTHWLHAVNGTQTLIEHLLKAAAGLDVQLEAWGHYRSPNHSDSELYAVLLDQLCARRRVGRIVSARLLVVRLHLRDNSTWELDHRLRQHPSYVGYADLNYPTTLRTLAAEILTPTWHLACD